MLQLIHDDLSTIVAREPSWARLKKARIFLTGGTGFFGTWMLATLQRANLLYDLNLDITVLARDPTIFLRKHSEFNDSSAIRFHTGDITNFDFPNRHIDYVIHFATTSAKETYFGEDQLQKLNTLYVGTKRVLDFAVTAGASKVLFSSSGVVYGPTKDSTNGLKENHLGAPDVSRTDSGLAEGKRIAEYLLAYYKEHHRIDYAIARCFSFVGPYLPLDLHYAIGNFIGNCLKGEDLPITGDGSPLRSYLYIADAINWLLRMILSSEPAQILNLGSARPISIMDLAYLTKNVLRAEGRVVTKNHRIADIGNFPRSAYFPDVSAAQSVLNVKEWTPLELAIEKTASFYRLAN